MPEQTPPPGQESRPGQEPPSERVPRPAQKTPAAGDPSPAQPPSASRPAPAPRATPLVRAVLVAAAATVIGVLATASTTLFPGPDAAADAPLVLAVRTAFTMAGVVPLVWAAARFLDRRPLAAFGLGRSPRGWATPLAALLAPLLATALLLGVAVAVGAASVDPDAATDAALTLAVVLPLLLLAQLLPEELVFRGYAQHVLGDRFSPWAALLIQAALFAVSAALVTGAYANTGYLFLLGVFTGVLRMNTGDVWTVLAARTALAAGGLVFTALDLRLLQAPGLWEALLVFGPALAALWAVTALRSRRPALASGVPDAVPGPRRELQQKGILYDVGSSYLPGQHSRPRWRSDVVDEEMRVIREDLHCTAVMVFGEDLGRLEEAARLALAHGLYVWVQPRLVDGAQEEVVARLARTAEFSERLREEHPDRVGVNVGCELSVFVRGIVPGRDFGSRSSALGLLFPLFPLFNHRLGRLLGKLAATARARFGGPLTYGAGTWESVNWTPFDVIGVDYYLDVLTRATYRQGLRRLRATGKPVLVTEFGCCSYEAARYQGGSGADIMDWADLDDRRVTGDHVRDERVQAEVIGEMLDVYETEDVMGAFVCMFIEGDCHHSCDPTRDLDMASFGIVRPPTPESGLSPDDGHWEPKEAFHTLAARYAARVTAEDS
ncbi:type II CAAX prenyl endopeptidase Rce1 family protein [Nocardiopsis sp. NPDC058631]|uniref:CPBP family glutamic-type intramembrane protease n=1 Tax=Nocardiopsis sp. NPDC058631 TaxID=3346566 RepID=UPI00366056AD